MLDFFLYFMVPMFCGGFVGFILCKYQYSHSELCENITIIKEDLANLQVQFSAYFSK